MPSQNQHMPAIPLHAYVAKIEALVDSGEQDEAIAHCRHILRLYPKYYQVYGLLGHAALGKGMYREARELLKRALSVDPESSSAWVGLARTYAEEDLTSEAVWAMERALELAPGDRAVCRELERLRKRTIGAQRLLEGPPVDCALSRGALGRLYAQGGLRAQAIDEFQSVLRENPHLPHIRVALAELLWRTGRYPEAVEVCLNILRALPHCLKANLVLAAIWQRGNSYAAEGRIAIARALDPENRVAQGVLAGDSLLSPQEVWIPVLQLEGRVRQEDVAAFRRPRRSGEVPDWVRALEPPEE
jgi:tetratricopeptide (TPR) repeat protein